MLSPVFSVQQIKGLVPVFYPIAYEVRGIFSVPEPLLRLHAVLQLRDVFAEEIRTGRGVVDVFNWLSLTALEYIGRGGLGYSFDALDTRKTNEYNEHIKNAMYAIPALLFSPITHRFRACSATMTTLYPVISLLPYIGEVGPAWFRRKLVDWTPSKAVRRLRDISDIMQETSEGILHKKKVAMEEGEEAVSHLFGNGKDIMTTLRTCIISIIARSQLNSYFSKSQF